MSSLHRHLQAQDRGDHDQLAFRPDCPLCRGRLAGRHPDARLLSRRAETAAAGVLVAGSLLPATGALAGEPGPVGGPTPSPPPAVMTDDGDAAGNESGVPPPSAEPVAPPAAVMTDAPEKPAAEAPPGAPAVMPDLPEEPPAEPPPAAQMDPSSSPADPESPQRPRPRPASRAPSAAPPADSPAPDSASSGEDEGAAAHEHDPSAEHAGPKGDGRDHGVAARVGEPRPGTHTVQPGDSLWVIAERVLAPGASDARVAAQVERLWQLNAEQIGTGDPDLIHPGQQLRLP